MVKQVSTFSGMLNRMSNREESWEPRATKGTVAGNKIRNGGLVDWGTGRWFGREGDRLGRQGSMMD